MDHPYLVSILFTDLLSLHLVTFSMFFVLVRIMYSSSMNSSVYEQCKYIIDTLLGISIVVELARFSDATCTGVV